MEYRAWSGDEHSQAGNGDGFTISLMIVGEGDEDYDENNDLPSDESQTHDTSQVIDLSDTEDEEEEETASEWVRPKGRVVNLDQDLIEGGAEGVQLNIFSDVELNQIQDLLDSVDPEDVIQMNPDEDLEVYIDRMDDSTVGSRAGPYDDSGFDSTAGTGAHFFTFFSLFPPFQTLNGFTLKPFCVQFNQTDDSYYQCIHISP